jgi:hypothetical protein
MVASKTFDLATPTGVSKIERLSHLDGGGHDFIERFAAGGWRPIPAWGMNGWDLGEWPLVVVLHRERPCVGHAGKFSLAYYIEGDVVIEHFASREERDAATDELAAFHWRHQGVEWVSDYPEGPLPEHLRGPYSRARRTGRRDEMKHLTTFRDTETGEAR